eukprot:scaffold338_cov361-Pavlova_lutheri.AAC.2
MGELMPRYPKHVPIMGRNSDGQVRYGFSSCRPGKEALRVFGRDWPWRNGMSNAGNGRQICSSERAFGFQQPSSASNGPVERMGRRGATRGMTAWCSASYVYVQESRRPSFAATRRAPRRRNGRPPRKR